MQSRVSVRTNGRSVRVSGPSYASFLFLAFRIFKWRMLIRYDTAATSDETGKKEQKNIFRTDQSGAKKSNDVVMFHEAPCNIPFTVGNRIKKPSPTVQ